jgi:hypothetical protein
MESDENPFPRSEDMTREESDADYANCGLGRYGTTVKGRQEKKSEGARLEAAAQQAKDEIAARLEENRAWLKNSVGGADTSGGTIPATRSVVPGPAPIATAPESSTAPTKEAPPKRRKRKLTEAQTRAIARRKAEKKYAAKVQAAYHAVDADGMEVFPRSLREDKDE